MSPSRQNRNSIDPIPSEDQLLSRAYVARWLGIDYDTLYSWERQHKGPRVIRLGRHVKYIRKDVTAWLDQQRAKAG